VVNQISKVRRGDDKKKVDAAMTAMIDDEQAAIDELIQMDADLFGDIDGSHWLDWDDFSEHDFDPLPEDDYVEENFIEDDPFEDEDDFYDPFWEMGYDLD